MDGQRRALIIANDEYEQGTLQNLRAPSADAEALGRVLGDPQIGEFAVQVVHNQPSYVIQSQIEEMFSESRPDDVLLLHFSGHGLKSESGELFFAAANTRPNRLGSTAVPADFVRRCMRDSRSHSVVLLLDCCYGGAFAQGVTVRASGDVNVLDSFPREGTGGGRGRAVITASGAMQYAFEGEHLADDHQPQPSVFTAALVEGLATGDADRDEDGWVSLNELYDYVFDKVRQQNPHQTPTRDVELEGELYLARSRRQRIRPTPIPPDLKAAMADPNMYARLGAVAELRARLASDNLPAAVGAYEALAELAHTDVRYVADPAAAALSEAAVQPARTEVQFGRVEQGSAPSHQVVQLLGPPVARACVPRPSSNWIRVDQTAEGLDIWIDTGSAGTLHGSLDLKGPTGEAVIVVEIDIVSPAPEAAASGPGGPALDEVAAAVPVDVQPGAPPASAGPSPSSAADALPPSGAYVSPAEDTSPADAASPAEDTSPADAASPADAPPQDASEPVRPTTDLPDTGSEPATPEPGPHGSQDRPGTASEPSAESVPAGQAASAVPAPAEAPRPVDRPGPARKTAVGSGPGPAAATALGAAGYAVLGVQLFLVALTAVLTLASYSGLWHTVIAAAVLGLLISLFERPLQQLEPFLHGWISLWFIIYAILILTAPHTRPTFITLLVIGAVSSAACAAFAFMRIARAGSSASNVIPAIAIVLMTISLVIVTLAVAQTSGGLGLLHAAGVVLFVASLACLAEALVMLAERSRPIGEPGKGQLSGS